MEPPKGVPFAHIDRGQESTSSSAAVVRKRSILLIDGGYLYFTMKSFAEESGAVVGHDADSVRAFLKQISRMIPGEGGRGYFDEIVYISTWKQNEAVAIGHQRREPAFIRSMRQNAVKVENHPLKTMDVRCKDPHCRCVHKRNPIQRVVQAGVDVAIATRMLQLLLEDKVDRLVLLAGDGDFETAVQLMVSKGVELNLCCSRHTTSARLLPHCHMTRGEADIIHLEDVWNEVSGLPPSREETRRAHEAMTASLAGLGGTYIPGSQPAQAQGRGRSQGRARGADGGGGGGGGGGRAHGSTQATDAGGRAGSSSRKRANTGTTGGGHRKPNRRGRRGQSGDGIHRGSGSASGSASRDSSRDMRPSHAEQGQQGTATAGGAAYDPYGSASLGAGGVSGWEDPTRSRGSALDPVSGFELGGAPDSIPMTDAWMQAQEGMHAALGTAPHPLPLAPQVYHGQGQGAGRGSGSAIAEHLESYGMGASSHADALADQATVSAARLSHSTLQDAARAPGASTGIDPGASRIDSRQHHPAIQAAIVSGVRSAGAAHDSGSASDGYDSDAVVIIGHTDATSGGAGGPHSDDASAIREILGIAGRPPSEANVQRGIAALQEFGGNRDHLLMDMLGWQ